MDRSTYLRHWSALHGGADPSGRLVGGWLAVVHAVATPLVRLRVPPDLVTLLGLAVAFAAPALAAAGGPAVVVAAVVVALSGLVDSLDGAVAVMTDRVSRWGAVLDALADRISDAAFVAALWILGAPPTVCMAAVAICWLHEYARARAGAAGMSDVGVITVAERPTRVIIVTMSLLATAARPDEAWPTIGAWTLVGVGLVGFGQLLLVVRSRLTEPA